MVVRAAKDTDFLRRTGLVRGLLGFLFIPAAVVPVEAALLPEGFFDMNVRPGQGAAAVEADRLSYDGRTDVISAEGAVLLSYQGFSIRADRLSFNQRTGQLEAVGNVAMRDPSGGVYEMDRIEVTGAMK